MYTDKIQYFNMQHQYSFYLPILAGIFQLEGLKYAFGAFPHASKLDPRKKNVSH